MQPIYCNALLNNAQCATAVLQCISKLVVGGQLRKQAGGGHLAAHITINSLHTAHCTWSHTSRSIHCTATAHCTIMPASELYITIISLHTASWPIRQSCELWATYHDQFTAQQLCTAQSCLHVNNISRSIQCTLHTAPRGRYHNSLARLGCEQCITINSPHSKWYWDSAVCSGGLKYVFQ